MQSERAAAMFTDRSFLTFTKENSRQYLLRNTSMSCFSYFICIIFYIYKKNYDLFPDLRDVLPFYLVSVQCKMYFQSK